ncbi:MAG TPA: aminotransferase class V-fold PLP-dependent enzyme [Microvirga sp.]|nr:aminotransferase class V-fold PLP-dependent enzyme [Microvirga sp.]
MLDLARHFSRFLNADPERIHLAAHSHHYWPDVTFEAQRRCWEDAALHADEKWGLVFGDLIPAVQAGIARVLNLPDPSTIAFAPNTHDFLRRLLSVLPPHRAGRVLTSDGEFHSLTRQIARLEEERLVEVERVPVDPAVTFPRRFAEACARGGHDLVYVSQVFFNSGATAGDLSALAAAVRDPETVVAVDGYHGFMALPTDLAAVADRIFYLAGGYKYAMAGEGVCFMHCPPGYAPRPRDTGWFAAFGALASKQSGVPYGSDGTRFLGATFDPSGLYRLRAVLAWTESIGLTVAAIHAHVLALQRHFLQAVAAGHIEALTDARLVSPAGDPQRGHFLTFETDGAESLHRELLAKRIVTDVRASRIRLGFGCYHTIADIDRAVARLERAAPGPAERCRAVEPE